MHLCVAAFLACFLAVQGNTAASPPTSRADLEAAAKWLETLGWPKLAGASYGEIALVGRGPATAPMRGLILAEDDDHVTFLGDGTHPRDPKPGSDGGWPGFVRRIAKRQAVDVNSRKLDLADTAAQLASDLARPVFGTPKFNTRLPEPLAAFLFSQFCVRLGRADLAEPILAQIPRWDEAGAAGDPQGTFQQRLEEALARLAMAELLEAWQDRAVMWLELLARAERLLWDFGGAPQAAVVRPVSDQLRAMIVEGQDLALSARPFEALAPAEQARGWILHLRDCAGSADEFWESPQDRPVNPAPALVALGYEAVPALLEALPDERLTRVAIGARSLAEILTVGDCAEAILARIAQKESWQAEHSEQSPSRRPTGALAEVQRAAQAWWQAAQSQGEKAELIRLTRLGTLESERAAERLAKIDPAAAVEALAAALSPHVERVIGLLHRLNAVQTPAATAELVRQAKSQRKARSARTGDALPLAPQGTDRPRTRRGRVEALAAEPLGGRSAHADRVAGRMRRRPRARSAGRPAGRRAGRAASRDRRRLGVAAAPAVARVGRAPAADSATRPGGPQRKMGSHDFHGRRDSTQSPGLR